ncbi:MAG: lipase family protein [Phascolarctobacterium sp.]|nr:lipase family protein [Phascolarctobacterium sp.]
MVITGHSLGGAAATLLGERLARLGMPKEKFTVITFGAPAIGNKVFVDKYGDKINLLRVTNEADPIPGSVQTFFSVYKQFGAHYKYDLSTKVSNIQHAMALYFDHSVNEYFNAATSAAKAGLIQLRSDKNIEEGKPLVAVWVKAGKGLSVNQYIPNLKGFITGCYKNSLPSYVIMDQSLTELPQDELLRLSRETGAKYMLACNIDTQKVPNEEYSYIVLGQGLFDTNGKMITMGSFAKKIIPESGYIQVTGENFLQARDALGEQIPVITQYRELPLLPIDNEGAVF